MRSSHFDLLLSIRPLRLVTASAMVSHWVFSIADCTTLSTTQILLQEIEQNRYIIIQDVTLCGKEDYKHHYNNTCGIGWKQAHLRANHSTNHEFPDVWYNPLTLHGLFLLSWQTHTDMHILSFNSVCYMSILTYIDLTKRCWEISHECWRGWVLIE